MADENVGGAAASTAENTEQKGTGKIVSAGQISSFKATPLPDVAGQQSQPQNAAVTNTGAAAEVTDTNTQAAASDTGTQAAADTATQITDTTKPLTDEELKTEYEKRFPQATELTDEQKVKQAKDFEKRMLDLYVENGGSIENFALLKQIAAADLTELSKAELTRELKELGITNEDEIKAIQKERYYQLEQAEIDEIEDETERALAQKKFDYGKKKFEAIGTNKKEEATDILDNLKKALTAKEFYTQKESEFTSNVEEHFNKLERKINLELGKVDDIEIAPVAYEFPDTVVAEAKDILKDIAKRKELLFNATDGSLNLKNIAELVLKSKAFDSAVKTGFLEGQTRQVEEFKKVFPFVDPKAVGVGGSSQSDKPKGTGQIVKAGQPQRFTPQKR